ncbi:MAG: 30S ribosomal protein S16 [Caldilineaceae bacterium]|nr:30S ribosomal protein S16 [Caldilineaceae bacterium]
MIRIRLRRMGAKRKAFYRIVVADGRSPRDGRFIETIGTYDPAKDTDSVVLKEERAAHWLQVGAQPTDSVALLLRRANLLDENGKPVPYVAETSTEEATEAVAEPA